MGNCNKRDGRFEILRVFSMILIIFHHYGCFKLISNFGGKYSIMDIFLFSGGKLGVALFAMITGYFMIHQKIKIKKLLYLEGKVLFYTIILSCIISIVTGKSLGPEELFLTVFPNLGGVYWFFSSYFILYLIIPILNQMISKFCFKTYFYFLLTDLVFFMIFPVIFKNGGRLVGTFYLAFYYCLGAFFRNYYKSSDREMIYLIGGIFTYLLIVIFSFIFNQNRASYYTSFSDINSIFIVLCSIFVFLFFLCQKKFSCNKFLLLCGNSTFGVYLFHEHFLVKEILWKIFFKDCNHVFVKLLFVIFICFFVVFLFDYIWDMFWNFLISRKKIKLKSND